jgi:hypothetical protein
MKYWSQIVDGKVFNVIVADDINALELSGVWIETFSDGGIRKNFGGIGYLYNETLDAFIPPKCHTQATLDESICRWTCDDDEHKSTII